LRTILSFSQRSISIWVQPFMRHSKFWYKLQTATTLSSELRLTRKVTLIWFSPFMEINEDTSKYFWTFYQTVWSSQIKKGE
jgi:hypothetical protein